MANFFADNFSGCVWLAVLLMSMLPMIESKVAIPFALSTSIWAEKVLSPFAAFSLSLLGSVVPAFLVILLVRFVKKRTAGFVCEKFLTTVEERYSDKVKKVASKGSLWKKCLALATFVAIPLPLTGVYTGGIIAGLLDIKIWQGFVSVLVGEVISCAIVLAVCLLFENSTFYIFIISLILVAVWAVVSVIAFLVKRFRSKRKA